MARTLLLALAVIGVATFVAVGSYSALAGSDPVSDVAGAVIGQDAPDGEDDDAVADDADDDEGDEADEVENEADVEVEEETGEGAENVAQVIADAFGVSQEEVLALHDEGIGFGALFKLYQLSLATGVSVQDLLASMEAEGEGYAFGKRFRALTEEQRAALDGGPKNLGELVSASHHADGDGESEDADAASQALEKAREKFAAHDSKGNGPPDGVPAHGHN